ncbi:nucleoporin p58/p45 isoform X2 [Amia ocellicauda]|uniref:nucleoporin p58/p45 isoform X2 n=1 Tax=Amia ocellicauda TaxID=2972642 RepID=UPI003464249F
MSGFNFGAGAGAGALGATTAGGGFSFGATTSNPAATGGFAMGGMGTGTAVGTATTTTTSSLGLGGSLFAQKPTGFSFGTPTGGTAAAAAPATGLTLGAPAAATTASTTGFALGFNKPAASATPFSLPASSASGGLTLGATLASTAPQAGSTGFALNLGSAIATSAPASTGLTLGSTLTGLGSTLTGLGSSLFQNTAATGLGQASQGLWLGTLGTVTTSNPTSSASLGLGGVDFSTSSEKKSDKSSGARPEDSKALKDENLPPVICQDVDNFQKFVKEQKQLQEEISRMSSKAMLKVQDDIKSLKQLLSVSASGLQRNALAIDKLKVETAQELKNADIALRTQKTPPGLQHENSAPTDYFRGLVEQFELQLQQYRQQIEELENHLTTQASSSHITPQDLSMAMQKLYQTFVALAAQLQSVHENVKNLKHQYLGYRKAFLEDSTDVFESKRAANKKWESGPRVTTGPTPFSSVPNAAAVAMAATLTQQQQPASAFGGAPGFGVAGAGGSSFGFATTNKPTGGSLSAGFGSSSTSGFNFSNPGITASAGLTFGVSNTPATGFGAGGPLLQLKKPPAGNKRGKR